MKRNIAILLSMILSACFSPEQSDINHAEVSLADRGMALPAQHNSQHMQLGELYDSMTFTRYSGVCVEGVLEASNNSKFSSRTFHDMSETEALELTNQSGALDFVDYGETELFAQYVATPIKSTFTTISVYRFGETKLVPDASGLYTYASNCELQGDSFISQINHGVRFVKSIEINFHNAEAKNNFAHLIVLDGSNLRVLIDNALWDEMNAAIVSVDIRYDALSQFDVRQMGIEVPVNVSCRLNSLADCNGYLSNLNNIETEFFNLAAEQNADSVFTDVISYGVQRMSNASQNLQGAETQTYLLNLSAFLQVKRQYFSTLVALDSAISRYGQNTSVTGNTLVNQLLNNRYWQQATLDYCMDNVTRCAEYFDFAQLEIDAVAASDIYF